MYTADLCQAGEDQDINFCVLPQVSPEVLPLGSFVQKRQTQALSFFKEGRNGGEKFNEDSWMLKCEKSGH